MIVGPDKIRLVSRLTDAIEFRREDVRHIVVERYRGSEAGDEQEGGRCQRMVTEDGASEPQGRKAGAADVPAGQNTSATTSANTSPASHATPWRWAHWHTFLTSRSRSVKPSGWVTGSTAWGKSMRNSRSSQTSML